MVPPNLAAPWTEMCVNPGRESVLVGTICLLPWPLRDPAHLWSHLTDVLTAYATLRNACGASLVAQWLRIRLPMQRTWVQALVQEDPTCHGATKPVCHNYWACALEPASHNYWSRGPQLLKPARLEPMLRNKRSHHNEKPVHRNKEESLLAATRESLHAATKTQCSQK